MFYNLVPLRLTWIIICLDLLFTIGTSLFAFDFSRECLTSLDGIVANLKLTANQFEWIGCCFMLTLLGGSFVPSCLKSGVFSID